MRYERSLTITKRLSDLLRLIGCGQYSASGLAKQLGVSEQTVYRDIAFLRRQGHPIRARKRSASWVYQVSREATETDGDQGDGQP